MSFRPHLLPLVVVVLAATIGLAYVSQRGASHQPDVAPVTESSTAAPNRSTSNTSFPSAIASSEAGPTDGAVWRAMSSADAPEPRFHHSATWTGRDMIVWGGTNHDIFFQDGGRYDPSRNQWTSMSTLHAPSARSLHAAAWTGSNLIVWGGTHGQARSDIVADGGIYDPVADVWTPLPASPLRPRLRAAAAWTGQEVIFWGGYGGTDSRAELYGDGARYNPTTRAWTLLPADSAPSPRWGHSMIWTGHDVIVWGGAGGTNGEAKLNDGARFDPSSNRWSPMSIASAPAARYTHGATWTGRLMIVWGGEGNGVDFRDGATYDPASDGWLGLTLPGAPSPRSNLNAFWTGAGLLVWGGNDSRGRADLTGALYNLESTQWTSLPAPTLAPRDQPSVVWTGRDLIVWGGIHETDSAGSPQITLYGNGAVLRLTQADPATVDPR